MARRLSCGRRVSSHGSRLRIAASARASSYEPSARSSGRTRGDHDRGQWLGFVVSTASAGRWHSEAWNSPTQQEDHLSEVEAAESQDASDAPSFLFVGGKLRVDGRRHQDAERRVGEALGQLLQVKNLAVLIGAGASMHLGSPTIRYLGRPDIEQLIEESGSTVTDVVRGVLEAMTRGGELDLEAVLSTLSAGVAYARATNAATLALRDEPIAVDALVETRRLINRALAHACELPNLSLVAPEHREDPLAAHREFFRRLLRARRPDLPRIRVFTTNYDTLIEQTLDEAGVPYFDGFVGTVSRVFRPEVFEQDIYLPPHGEQRALTRLPEMLYFYKLHGSINWRSSRSPGALSRDVVVQQRESESASELALIYPTPQKESDVLGYPYSDLFRAFNAVVGTPETCLLVLGYGFSDDHINRFIFQALASSPTFQLFVVDPYAAQHSRDELTPAASLVGGLTGLDDARVGVLAGSLGCFDQFAVRGVPDPDESLERESPGDVADVLGRLLDGTAGEADEN